MEIMLVMVVMVVVWPHVVVTDSNLWVGIQEPSGFDSSQGTVKDVPNIRSQTQCAMRASMTPSSYMFQYDGGNCVLYDKKEDSQGQYKLTDNTITSPILYTRLHNVCIDGNNVYEEGDEMTDVDCRHRRCTNRTLEPIIFAPGLPCRSPFVEYDGGCFSLHQTELTWREARKYCVGLGGDLAYGPTFESLHKFLKANADEDLWVGGKERKWLDGNVLPATFKGGEYPWDRGEPNGSPDECVRAFKGGNYLVADRGCDFTFQFVCQLV